ncbi:MAG: yusV 1 [Firmicutes bacterium]|nr:yusV 1 [Bacillota bacterium]
MILEAKHLKLQYGVTTIAEDVSFVVEAADIISIIGPNGSGKSTLLKALGRLLKPITGTVFLDNKDIHKLSPAIIAKKLAILPQSAVVPTDMTVYDLVCYGRMPYQRMFADKNNEDLIAIDKALIATGIADMKYRRLDTLSGGERQRAWLALALAQEPEILLLDEPTTYLDIHHQLELMQLVSTLHHKLGITVIMVLHDLNHAARFSNRLVAVKEGKIMADGAVADVFTSETLRALYEVENTVMKIKQGESEHLVCLPHDVCLSAGA